MYGSPALFRWSMSLSLCYYHTFFITIASPIVQLEIWDGPTSSIFFVPDHFCYLVLFVFLYEMKIIYFQFLCRIALMHCHGVIFVVSVCGQHTLAWVIDLACYLYGKKLVWSTGIIIPSLLAAAGFLTEAKLSTAYEAPNFSCLWPFAEKFW